MKKLSFTSCFNSLLKLLVLPGLIALAMPTKACIVYTNENPDAMAWYAITGAINRAVAIDLDGDGNQDIAFTVFRDSTTLSPEIIWAGFAAIDSGNALAGTFYAGQVSTPYALSAGDTVGKPGQIWQTTYLPNPQTLGANSSAGSLAYGNWLGQTDKYLGLKFVTGGQIHYGWVRLDFRNSATGDTIIVKDYAYEDVPMTPIIAGAMPSPASDARALAAMDVANSNNGTDLELSFDKAADETTVQEYRVYVVRDTNAPAFDLRAAMAVASGNYTVIAKTGADITQTLGATAKDVNGIAIAENIPYQVFVLSIADGINATCNVLSDPSAIVTLLPGGIVITDPATTVVATDIANNHNGLDLQVTFTKAANEALVDDYRIIVVKNSASGTFTLSAANAITSGNYSVVAKTGSNITTVLTASSNDADGDAIVEDETYKVYVLSIADGATATINALSVPSDTVTLTSVNGIAGVQDKDVAVYSYANQVVVKQLTASAAAAQIKIYNAVGQTVYSAATSNTQEKISLNVPEGVYIVAVTINDRTVNRKVIITQ